MDEYSIFIVFIPFVIFIILFIIFSTIKRKYEDFVYENSIALQLLEEINKKYKFYIEFKNFDISNVYDNEINYNNVSCEDYLIYQLQYMSKNVDNEIKKIVYNRVNYRLYKDDVNKIKKIGVYKSDIGKLDKQRLINLENKIFVKNIKSPILDFNIKIKLSYVKMNNELCAKKKKTFSLEEIANLLKRLNNKRGDFFNDTNIWNSICNVERAKVSNKMRFAIYDRDGHKCKYCGVKDKGNNLEIDHIKPIAKGGKSTFDNLQTLCKRCNQEKGDNY